jgi:hypothetical protein
VDSAAVSAVVSDDESSLPHAAPTSAIAANAATERSTRVDVLLFTLCLLLGCARFGPVGGLM